MQDLRLVLIILGLVAIIVLIAHGLWANKKNQVKPLTDKPLDKLQPERKDSDGFDMDGIGAKRVISSGTNTPQPSPKEVVRSDKIEPQFVSDLGCDNASSEASLVANEPAVLTEASITTNETAEPTYTVPLSNVEDISDMPTMTATDSDDNLAPEQPLVANIDTPQVNAENITKNAMNDDVAEIEITEPEVNIEPAASAKTETAVEAPEEQVFVINIMARENQVINGAQLLQELLTLGFKFGEMDIFHRHVDGAGKGAVIFSLANMVKPGTFDIDHMEQFQTPGVSLFMMYPCAISVSKNYQMMLNAADRIASAVDGLLCDASRNPMTAEMIAEEKACVANIESKVALQQ